MAPKTEIILSNNKNNGHLSRAHERTERSHDTCQPKYDILYTCTEQSYQNNLHKVLYENTHTHAHTRTHARAHARARTHARTLTHTHTVTVAETGY